MFDQNGHLTDEELISLIDGEMPQFGAHQARAHCSGCSACQSRLLQIEQASADFADLYAATMPRHLLKSSPARSTMLKDRSTAAGPESSTFRPRQLARFEQYRPYLLIAAAILVLAGCGLFWSRASFESRSISAQSPIRLLPDNSMTPGATHPVSLTESCSQQAEDLDPAVSVSIRKLVFHEYGIKTSNAEDYQVDYLINPQLGGTDDVRNLWPEPYHSTVWNAHAKDALEDRLHQMVCNRQIDLASAQRELATNWIAAYKRHFHTETPS